MNIAIIPSAYAPAVGGVEVLTARLAHHLILRGHGVEVWTGRNRGDALREAEIIDGICVRRFLFTLPGMAASSLFGFAPAAISTFRRLRAAARKFNPDVLHVQCFSGNGAYATVLSRLTGIPLVVSLQGETVMDDHDIYDHSVALRSSLGLGLRRAAAVTGCSAFALRDAKERFGLDMGKAQVIFNGVDVDETKPKVVEIPFERYVLGLGRVVPKKGFDLLLDGFARLASNHSDVGLVIAGDGPERTPLRRRVLELDLGERVYLPGQLKRGEVASVMQGAEVFVMPSRVEPFGIVALEAWSAGVPIVVTPHGGPPEFVKNGVSGFVTDPFDSVELAAVIGTLLRDTALREKLAAAGRKAVDRFRWSHVAGSYEALYQQVSAGR